MDLQILTRDNYKDYLPKFVNLYRKCFSGSVNEQYFNWRYFERKDEDLLIAVCIDKKEVVAFSAVSPWIIGFQNKLFKGGVSLNVMTNPNYTGRSLFQKLTISLIERMRQEEYSFLTLFPNHVSNRTFNSKMNATTIYEIPSLELNVEEYMVENIDLLPTDNEFDLIYEDARFLREGRAHVLKDSGYLRWRYYQNPMNEYINFVINNNGKADGFVVCKEYEDKLNIVDIGFSSIIQVDNLIHNAIVYAKKTHKKHVTIWAPINTEFHLLLESMKFKNNYPIQYFSIVHLSDEDSFKELNHYNNWFVQLGDNCSVY